MRVKSQPRTGKTGRPAGRPTSRMTQSTRDTGEKWVVQGHETPLEVMLSNMEHFHTKAQALIKRAGGWTGPAQTLEEWNERMNLILRISNYRHSAQECARDAAPYMHPKLASIDIGQKDKKPWLIQMAPGDDKL